MVCRHVLRFVHNVTLAEYIFVKRFDFSTQLLYAVIQRLKTPTINDTGRKLKAVK